MRVQLHPLRLVYPPISNQEAEWLKDDPEVLALVTTSNLYMIGKRAEAHFANLRQIGDSSIAFDYTVQGFDPDPVELHFTSDPGGSYSVPDPLEIEAGDKYIRA